MLAAIHPRLNAIIYASRHHAKPKEFGQQLRIFALYKLPYSKQNTTTNKTPSRGVAINFKSVGLFFRIAILSLKSKIDQEAMIFELVCRALDPWGRSSLVFPPPRRPRFIPMTTNNINDLHPRCSLSNCHTAHVCIKFVNMFFQICGSCS